MTNYRPFAYRHGSEVYHYWLAVEGNEEELGILHACVGELCQDVLEQEPEQMTFELLDVERPEEYVKVLIDWTGEDPDIEWEFPAHELVHGKLTVPDWLLDPTEEARTRLLGDGVRKLFSEAP